MGSVPGLVVLAPGALAISEGSLHAPAKFVSGMSRYAELFPGEVWVLGRPGEVDRDNLGASVSPLADLPFGCRAATDLRSALATMRPDIAYLPLSAAHVGLRGVATTTIFSAEHDHRSWQSMASVHRPGWTDRLRMEVGYRRLERRLVRHVARADGVHCNGTIAWQAYARHSPSALRVYDSRVSDQVVRDAAGRARGLLSSPLRLGFSGRLTPIKGPDLAVGALRALERRGVDVTLDVYGDGPMRRELERTAGARARFHGELGFEQWCRRVPDEVDLMVLPHVQPDPSGTYLESAGLGIPVVGFDHEALVDLSRHGFAFATGERTADGLADLVTDLVADRAAVRAASAAGISFMTEHSFERDFAARIAHMLTVHQDRAR